MTGAAIIPAAIAAKLSGRKAPSRPAGEYRARGAKYSVSQRNQIRPQGGATC